ncbi:type II CAAX prenyl endopeptidase Rce1 family protein [Chryseobacterium indoltheticum]|uniref:CPBP family intramembrane glutamic endopeptidase n=1 Tax=Chryseobacterium indoltheticum TaxID=254 RepID=UPI0036F40A02
MLFKHFMYLPKNFAEAFILNAIFLICLFLPIFFSNYIPLKNPELNYTMYSLLGFALAFLVFLIINKFFKLFDTRIQYFKKTTTKISLWVIIVASLISISSYPIYFIINGMEDATSINFAYLLMSVIVAPVLEEFFYRGVILNNLIKNKSVKYSVLTIVVIFTISHFNFASIVGLVLLSIVTSFLFIMWKNIFYCILFHVMFNFSTYILSYSYDMKFILISSLIASIVLFLVIRKYKLLKVISDIL